MNIIYPDTLPISSQRDAIIAALRQHQVIVVAGETGSGKTTQLPKMVLEAFPDSDLLIGCTQPRRIAASTVSVRVAEELGPLAGIVGYKIRFHDETTPATRIKFMTDGVLLAETRQDRALSRYSTLIIDEAHERSLNIDFLLGYIKQLLPRRPELKIIITSATIDTQAFADHFDKAPILTIAGRSYPVIVRYSPPADDISDEKDEALDHCLQTVCDLHNNEPKGDILVFLPTERDIREGCLILEKKIPQAVILPLFGRLSAIDQRRIFQKQARVKIVLATNVAETSVTVPGIRYVVDSGLARISSYNVRAKTTSLPITRISRAACNQRKGRCGRIGPGICIRLYSEEDYNDRPEYTLPELQRSNLAEVILQMISLELGHPENFPFLDPPHKSGVKEGYQLLFELGAVDDKKQLTAIGRIMADLPIDPCISRIIIEARDNNCLREIKIIAAALAIQDPRIRPINQEKEADETHKVFLHPQSDFMTLLNIWNTFHAVQDKIKSWSRLKKYCKAYFLSFQRMREWIDLHEQLDRLLAQRSGFTDNSDPASYAQLHRSLLAGFLRNLARKKLGHQYQGGHNRELMVFPGSHQFMKGGQWLVAASFIETTRLYALTVATIEPEWIEKIAGRLCKYSWSNPHWLKKTGQVVAEETVTLFGLIISAGNKVNFAKRHHKNVVVARDIFIHSALLQGELLGNYAFLQHNLALISHWQEVEEKLRVRSIIVDEGSLYRFYAKNLPTDVYDQATLNRYLNKGKSYQDTLHMTDDDVLKRKPDELELIDYPPSLALGPLEIRLEYHFEPGSDHDGVTFRLPVDFALSVSPTIFEWLVPGLLPEKLTFLLKALPKTLRKKLVPISDTVNWLLDDMLHGHGSLYAALEASLLKRFKMLVQRTDWSGNLPLHLQPRFVLFSDDGQEICAGRNLRALLKKDSQHLEQSPEPTLKAEDDILIRRWKETEHKEWGFQGLPIAIPTYTHSGEISGFLYAVLLPQPDKGCVVIAFEKNKELAEQMNRRGTLYLYRLQFAEHFKLLKKTCASAFSGPSAAFLLDIDLPHKAVVEAFLEFLLSRIFSPLPPSIIEEQVFLKKVAEVRRQGFFATGKRLCDEFLRLLRKRRSIIETIEKIFSPGQGTLYLPGKKTEFLTHLEDIFPRDLLRHEAEDSFADLDRQLQCLLIRIERYYADPAKDSRKAAPLIKHLQNLQQLVLKKEDMTEEARECAFLYKTMINEYRIALFSPEIKTHQSISEKKLEEQWRKTQTRY